MKSRHLPELTVPEAAPLSPCIIDPYVKKEDVEGVLEENLAFVPVSLLMKAVEDDRMLNIAVTGNYGGGKSSVINTAEKHLGSRHHFIKISLASLLTQESKGKNGVVDMSTQKTNSDSGKQTGDAPKSKDEAVSSELSSGKQTIGVGTITDKQIEYSILQQILYHDRPQKTPKSRIRRIHKTRGLIPVFVAFLVILFFISLVIILNPNWIDLTRYYSLDGASGLVQTMFKWGPLGALAVIVVLFCCYVGEHFTFSVAKIGNKAVEMKVTEGMSIFNAYLDEIVYFFESTRYDVVVFEDLDRFSNKEVIFYNLRELNTILNNSQSLDRKINFVYAVLDHLFDASERVKFFDYIVTVIPVINSLNSYDKLKERIIPSEVFEKLGHTELHNLCDYLQDMRLLLNIVNEFNQFSPLMAQMDKSVMSYKVLFGLVVYKNYAPEDFSKMYNKEGVVAKIIEGADECRNEVKETLDLKIQDLQRQIQSFEEDFSLKLIALRKSYLEEGIKLSNYASQNVKIRVAGTPYTVEKLAEQQNLFLAVRTGQANYFVGGSSISTTVTPFNTIEANMGGAGHFDATVKGYKEELERYTDDARKKIKAIEEEKEHLRDTVSGIYQNALTSLDKALLGLKDIEKIHLVKFLILNGYLDRYYQYYISYIYQNSLHRGEDQTFVMRAARREGPQYEVRLKSIKEVIKRFTPEDFSANIALLNVDIVRAIFDKSYGIPFAIAYRIAICRLIASQNCLDFLLVAYRSKDPAPDAFFTMVLNQYDFWDEIEGRDQSEQDDLREVYIRFCDLREGRTNLQFLNWFSENYAFVDMRWPIIPVERIEKLFKIYNPVFKTLSVKNTPDAILQSIIENKRYVVTRQNVNAIVTKLGFVKEYRTAAYMTLRDTRSAMLMQTLEADWLNTLGKVFPDTSVHEDSLAMVSILNAALRFPSKTVFKSYLSRQRNRIKEAELLYDGILEYAYEHSLVEPTWQNVYYYAIVKGHGAPVSFLHNNVFHDQVGESLSTEEEEALRKCVVFTNDLKLVDYKKLVPFFSAPFTSIPSLIQPARMRILLEKNLLAFNEENYRIVRRRYSLSGQFIVSNLDTFLSAPLKYEIDKTDVIAVWRALPSKKAQCDFIRAIKDIDIVPDAELASLIRPYVVSRDLKSNELGNKLLLAVIIGAPNNQRIMIGRRAIVSLPYTEEMTTSILIAMGNEFNRITTDTSTSTIHYSRDAIYICNELVRLGYIKACEKRGDKILITKR